MRSESVFLEIAWLIHIPVQWKYFAVHDNMGKTANQQFLTPMNVGIKSRTSHWRKHYFPNVM